MFFKNRGGAGRALVEVMKKTGEDFSDFDVIGVARGGVIVGAEIARHFHLELLALCETDLAVGEATLNLTGLGNGLLHSENEARLVEGPAQEVANLLEKQNGYNSGREVSPKDKKLLVVDDGLVTGSSATTVLSCLEARGARELILVVPVVPKGIGPSTFRGFRLLTWRVSSLPHPTTGLFYFSFDDVPDEEVTAAVSSTWTPLLTSS
jgi:predicted phosphoribosyltransferase